MAPATGSHATSPHAKGVDHAPNAGSDAARALDAAVHESFNNMVTLRETFAAVAARRFGSGWAWLVSDRGKLAITTTPNQDNPVMEGVSPTDILLGLDVWEHA